MKQNIKYFGVRDAAEKLGVPYPTLSWWVRDRRVRAKVYQRAKTRTYRISERELARVHRLITSGLPV